MKSSLHGSRTSGTSPVTPKSSNNTLKNIFNSYMPKFLQSSTYSKS